VSNETLFYVVGICLVLAALALTFTGLRRGGFPSRAILIAVTGAFATLVVATAAFAVLQAQDEQQHREAELAEYGEEAAAEDEGPASGGIVDQEQESSPAGGALAPGPGPGEQPVGEGEQAGGGKQAAGGGTELDVTSPPDGSLVFEPDGLEAPAGIITLVYENPSSVPHSIAVESEGQELGATQAITDSEVELKQKLAPGEYIFYCTVPGHREGGMEGDLTVSGPE